MCLHSHASQEPSDGSKSLHFRTTVPHWETSENAEHAPEYASLRDWCFSDVPGQTRHTESSTVDGGGDGSLPVETSTPSSLTQ